MKFWVSGTPVPQGSKRIVQPPGVKRPLLIDVKGKELKAWRTAIAAEAMQHIHYPQDWTACPVFLFLEFHMPRGKTVKRALPCVTPDLDKLQRAVLDALTRVAYKDDGQVVRITASKYYAGERGPGVEIEVRQ